MKIVDYQTGGHAGVIEFQSEVILKTCKETELNFYEELKKENHNDDPLFIHFIPKYFGNIQNKIILENLRLGREYGSSLDVKIGKYQILKSNKKNYQNKFYKDQISSANKYFFKFSGFIYTDSLGNIQEKYNKKDLQKYSNDKKIIQILNKLFSSNDQKCINEDAKDQIIEQLNKIIEFFQNHSYYRFVSSSLFIIIDNINKSYVCKLIDFTHYEKLNIGQYDENFINGLTFFKQFLENLN